MATIDDFALRPVHFASRKWAGRWFGELLVVRVFASFVLCGVAYCY
jgi:hypothetical protein